MIQAKSLQDVSVLNNRYAVIRDTQGTYRVVSLVREPYRELQARENSGGISYVFNRTGANPSWDKSSYDQQALARMVTRYGKPPTNLQLNKLQERAVRFQVNPNHPLEPGDLQGIPTMINNHQLDPNKGGWVIATVTATGLLFGTNPKVHTALMSASAELERLASVSPGTEFVLLKAVKTAVSHSVQTKTFV